IRNTFLTAGDANDQQDKQVQFLSHRCVFTSLVAMAATSDMDERLTSINIIPPIPPFVDSRETSCHPDRCRIACEVVVEKLLQSDGEVFAITAVYQIVFLSVVLQHHCRLDQAA